MLLDKLRSGLSRAGKLEAGELSQLITHVGFRCMRCGWCCCPDDDYSIEMAGICRPSNAIAVLPRDIRTIMDGTGYDLLDVVEPDIYSCIRGSRMLVTGWIMKRRPDGTCRFFDDGENRCGIYEHRPLVCRCFPFFLDGSGMLEVRHCYGTHQQMDEQEAGEMGEVLLRYHISKIENYVALCEGIGDELIAGRLCEVGLKDGIVLHVFDGERTTVVEYSGGRGFWVVRV